MTALLVCGKRCMSSSRDDPLLRDLAAGREQALAELYDRYATPLFRVARAMLHDHAEARRARSIDSADQAPFLRSASSPFRGHGSSPCLPLSLQTLRTLSRQCLGRNQPAAPQGRSVAIRLYAAGAAMAPIGPQTAVIRRRAQAEAVASARIGYHGGVRTGVVPVQRPSGRVRP